MSLAEYTTPDALAALQDWWPFALVLFAILAWFVRREVKSFKAEVIASVTQRTEPIQPQANGGRSLADLHVKVDQLSRKTDQVQQQGATNVRRIAAMEQSIQDHLAAHRESDDQEQEDR